MTKNIDYFLEGPETLRGADRVARQLFSAIMRHHGEIEARRIFETIAKGMTKTDEARMKRNEILERYDRMPRPNVMELARQLEQEGLGTMATIDHRIRELLRKRKAAIAQGTWDGPPWHWPDYEALILESNRPADELTEAECDAALAILNTKRQ